VCPITGRNYSYIWFKSAIPALRKSFSKAMKKLEIKTSKWSGKKESAKQTFIGGKGDIIKYHREVGFSNPKHIKRFNAPVVQSGAVAPARKRTLYLELTRKPL